MTNPEYFPDPQSFDPGRYITEDGKFKPSPHIQPFGSGRRKCLGETLARMNVYLFFTGILSCFTVKKVSDADTSDPMDRLYGATVAPAPFKVKFVPRK